MVYAYNNPDIRQQGHVYRKRHERRTFLFSGNWSTHERMTAKHTFCWNFWKTIQINGQNAISRCGQWPKTDFSSFCGSGRLIFSFNSCSLAWAALEIANRLQHQLGTYFYLNLVQKYFFGYLRETKTYLNGNLHYTMQQCIAMSSYIKEQCVILWYLIVT